MKRRKWDLVFTEQVLILANSIEQCLLVESGPASGECCLHTVYASLDTVSARKLAVALCLALLTGGACEKTLMFWTLRRELRCSWSHIYDSTTRPTMKELSNNPRRVASQHRCLLGGCLPLIQDHSPVQFLSQAASSSVDLPSVASTLENRTRTFRGTTQSTLGSETNFVGANCPFDPP